MDARNGFAWNTDAYLELVKEDLHNSIAVLVTRDLTRGILLPWLWMFYLRVFDVPVGVDSHPFVQAGIGNCEPGFGTQVLWEVW